MTEPLWTWTSLVAAARGNEDRAPTVALNGFSIDTRTLQPGDVFVALKDVRDGHDFVTHAFKAGAGAAIVSIGYERRAGDGALLRVADPLAALELIGTARRAELAAEARVVAVTGSAGKTGTKEMLRACFQAVAPGRVHASEKSYNNHWGVPLTLARMPAGTRYAVFEIGMNHAGEITPLSQMVRPHAAIITTVEAVHLEHFASVDAIADAKAEIFAGLVPGGTAIIKHDSPHRARLTDAARRGSQGLHVVSFGLTAGADVVAESLSEDENGSTIAARLGGRSISYRLAMPGRHVAENSLALVAALQAVGADVAKAVTALAELPPPPGRGQRVTLDVGQGEALLIDESYNANPASMRAALATLSAVPRGRFGRRIVVLGDMRELGPQAGELHRGLADAVTGAGADLFFACGPLMRGLYDALPANVRGAAADTVSELQPLVAGALRAGDVVIVKASNGTRLWALVEGLKSQFGVGADLR